MQTVESLMKLVEEKVANNEPISPAYWSEISIRVLALSGEVDNKLAHLEAQLIHIKAEYIKQDLPANKAEILAKDSMDYAELLRTRALASRIKDFIINVRKRSQINEV